MQRDAYSHTRQDRGSLRGSCATGGNIGGVFAHGGRNSVDRMAALGRTFALSHCGATMPLPRCYSI